MGQRSRKRGQRQKAVATPPAVRAERPSREARTEQRNAAVRAELQPLTPGERPWPIVVGCALAALLGAATVVMYAAGVKTSVGGKPGLGEVVIYGGLMFACAGGMWKLRSWAVLGFMTLLAIGLLEFTLALTRVTTIVGALVCVALLGAGGYLFWKFVRVLSRIQMPQYRRRGGQP